MLTICLTVFVAVLIAVAISLKNGNFTGWSVGLGISSLFVGFILAEVFSGLVPTSTVLQNYTHQLADLESADKLHAQTGFMYMFGIVGYGSGTVDEQYTYEFWARNNDGSASHFKLRDGIDTVRVFQDAAAGRGTWTVQVSTTAVPDQNSKWYQWSLFPSGFTSPSSTTTTVNYFHVPYGTIVQQFKLQ
jgi:hypothetical protein